MIYAKPLRGYSKQYSVVLCAFILMATFIEFVINQNQSLTASDCASDIYQYVTMFSVFNVAFGIAPLVVWCCTHYILFNITMMCVCFIFLIKSTWAFYIFMKYFVVGGGYTTQDCTVPVMFYNQLGVINIEIVLATLNVLILTYMLYFYKCEEKYITKTHYLTGLHITNDRTINGEIKTNTYTSDFLGDNTIVVNMFDMNNVIYSITGCEMSLIGLRNLFCYLSNDALQNMSFYNETVGDLETYALFSTSLYITCGILLILLCMFNGKNKTSVPIAVCIFTIYILCMCGAAIKYLVPNYSDNLESGAYKIYSIAQFDSYAVFFMIFVPCLLLNCAEIYVIAPENTYDELPQDGTAVLVDDDIMDSNIDVLHLENESLDNTELQTACVVGGDNY